MPHTIDPRKYHSTFTCLREVFARFAQKNERLGITNNEAIAMILDDYGAKEKLSEKWENWVKDGIKAELEKRGMTEGRIGKGRGLGKKTLARIKKLS